MPTSRLEQILNWIDQNLRTDGSPKFAGLTVNDIKHCDILTVDMSDISTASSVWVVAPYAGKIVKIYSVINGAITVGDAAITVELGGTAVTGAGITIANSGSAAGIVDSSTPTALNTVTAGQAIEIISNGGSTDTCRATFTVVIERS